MPAVSACPEPQQLQSFARGLAPPPAVEAIAQHLQQCPACAARLQTLRQSDTVLDAVRGDTDKDPPLPAPAAPMLVKQLQQLAPPPTPAFTPRHDVAGPLPIIPGYNIRRRVGHGGMGVVYEAEHLALKRTVALKVILAGGHADVETLDRFRGEAEAVARLQHPNIVQIYDVGEHDGLPYFAMEFVEGAGLDQKLAGNPQPPSAAATLVEQLARAMHAAHERGVVHRDLKPANVLLAAPMATDAHLKNAAATPSARGSEAPFVPKIADFGLAKRLDDAAPKTASGVVMGTPCYMAPEQALGQSRDIGPAADVYALGAILYEMLTGRPPFKGATDVDTLLQVISQDPVEPTQLNPAVPRDLETITLKCLQREPYRRYSSALELSEDLRRFLTGQPVLARPTPAWERAVKWVKRRPTVAALGAVSVVAVLVMAGGGLAFTRQLQDERDNAVWLTGEVQKERDNAVTLSGQLQKERDNAVTLTGQVREERDNARTQEAKAKKQELLAESRRVFAETEGTRAKQEKLRADAEKTKAERQLEQTRQTLFTTQLLRVAAVGQRDPDLGRQLLHDTRSCPLDLRDFAWRYYDRLCQREQFTLVGHTGVVRAVAFSPDGKLLASGGGDKTIRVWDTATRKLLTTLPGDSNQIMQLSFAHDSGTLVSLAGDGTVKLWDAATWKERVTLRGMNGPVAFTPDGRAIVHRDKAGLVKVWDSTTGQEIDSFQGPAGDFRSLALTSDRKVLALGSGQLRFETKTKKQNTGEVVLWDVPAGKERASFKDLNEVVTCLAFSPDGRTLASGGGLPIPFMGEGEVMLWDVALGKPGVPLQGRVVTGVTGLAFSPDGKTLAAGAMGFALSDGIGEIKVWEVVTGQERLSLSGRANYLWGIAFAPDGKTLASAQADATVKVWDVSPEQARATLVGHPRWVLCLACSKDGTMLASGSSDGTINLWDLATRSKRATLNDPSHLIQSVSFSPDGRTLASGSLDNVVQLWDVASGKCRATYEFPSSITCVAYSPDGNTLAISSQNGAITLWDVQTAKARTTLKGHTGKIESVAFSPDGKSLASGGQNRDTGEKSLCEVKLWDLATGKERFALEGFPGTVYSVAFSPNGRTLAAGGGISLRLGQPGAYKLWDVATGKEIAHIRGHNERIHALAFTTDGKTLVTGSFDNANNIKLWDVATCQERATLEGHTNGIQCLAIPPNGTTLISGSGDLTVKIWEAVPEMETGTLLGHDDQITDVRFGPDGKTLASASYDKTVRIWNTVTGEQRAALKSDAGPVFSIAWHPDGRTLAAGVLTGLDEKIRRYTSGEVQLWDVATGRVELPVIKLKSAVLSVAFSGDGKTLATGSADKAVKLWDVATGTEQATFTGHSAVVFSLAFSPDGKTLASGSGVFDSNAGRYSSGEIILWDVASGQRRATLKGHRGLAIALAFSADGKHLASGSGEGTIIVWDLTSEKQTALTGHAGIVRFVAFSEDGQRLLSGSEDGTVRLWDIDSGKETASIKASGKRVTAVTVDGDGRLAWGLDRALMVWKVAAGWK